MEKVILYNYVVGGSMQRIKAVASLVRCGLAALVLLLPAAAQAQLNRERLSSGLVLQVRKNGSDSADCRSQQTACATIQRAMDRVCYDFDRTGHAVVILVERGRYPPVALCSYVGLGGLGQETAVVVGDAHDANAVMIAAPEGDAIITIAVQTPWTFRSLGVEAPGGAAVKADLTGFVALDGVAFGRADIHAQALHGGKIEFVNHGYSILGPARAHWHASLLSEIFAQPGLVIDLPELFQFDNFAYASFGSQLHASYVKFVGAAKGRRWLTSGSSGISLNGAYPDDVFPGDAPGDAVADGAKDGSPRRTTTESAVDSIKAIQDLFKAALDRHEADLSEIHHELNRRKSWRRCFGWC